ncbi:phosphoglucosamine mutase [soil metagenome]
MSGAALMLSVSGVRGIVGASLTPSVVTRFAGTVGAFVTERANPSKIGADTIVYDAKPKAKKTRRPIVVLARDGRFGGHVVRDAARAGLLSAGCDVIDIGVAMTPTCGVCVDSFDADAGMIITASHNPQEWNGLKVLLREEKGRVSACAPNKSTADALIKRFQLASAAPADQRAAGYSDAPLLRPWNEVGDSEDAGDEAIYAHAGQVTEALTAMGILPRIAKAKLAVALDSVNGAGRVMTPGWLEGLGCKVHATGIDDSGLFPHTPEPTRENLAAMTKNVKRVKAAVGFAQDPDADRLALIDERGVYIGEEYTLVLATMALGVLGALKKGSRLAVNLSTSRMIEDVAATFGCTVDRSAVGEANVVQLMKDRKSPIGGEGNGGVIWPAVTYVRDSIGAMGLVLGLMAKSGKSLSQLVASTPSYAIEKRKVELTRREEADTAQNKIAKAFKKERVDRQDGVRVDFAARRAWLHVRASNTEPIMRIIAEAPTKADALALLAEANAVIGLEPKAPVPAGIS